MKKLLIALLVVTIAALVGGAVYESKMETKDAATYKPVGKLVDAGGRKLDLVCAGAGSPTVIFESSGLSSSVEWEKLLS
ncbi:MAG TPA: alpha/beta hydrolase, partial [Polyangia bacterium]